MAPAGTPADIIDKLHRESVRILALPDVRKRFDELGIEVIGNTPAEFAAVIAAETPQWAKVIRDAGDQAGGIVPRPQSRHVPERALTGRFRL